MTSEALVMTSEALVMTSEALVMTSEALVMTSEALVMTSEVLVMTSEALVMFSEVLVMTSEALGVSHDFRSVSYDFRSVSYDFRSAHWWLNNKIIRKFFSDDHKKISSLVMKTFKFSLVLCTRENTDLFIALNENSYGIHSKRVNILYVVKWRCGIFRQEHSEYIQ